MADEPITVPKRTYDAMQSDLRLLDCLFEVGVDKWIGFAEAQELKRQKEQK